MNELIVDLDAIIKTISGAGSLATETLHKAIFCSLTKAGLSLYGAQTEQESEIERLIQTIPATHRGLVNGRLYLNCLGFVKSFNAFLKKPDEAVMLREADVRYVLEYVKEAIRQVDAVIVLDCASIPEIITFAGKLAASNHNITIYDKVFINPIGVTSFVTGQLGSFGREAYLREYARLLKETLHAKFFVKTSTIDLVTHQQGVSVENFLDALQIQKIYDQINHFAKQNTLLITSDHGYDVVADEHGLYITHGYTRDCPLNFSKIALFLVID